MATNENSKNINVLHDVTPEEGENLRKKKKKWKNEGSIFLEDMQRLEKLNNISFPKASMSRKEWRTQIHWGKNKCPCSSRKILFQVSVRDNSFIGSSITRLHRANLTQAN